MKLKRLDTLQTIDDGNIKVIEKLGDGGQGVVYK